ncbi:MAG: GNAT family N-acetyltransferase [Mycobacterium sp.]|nr:GNAT family N-acetyltransferase [Mycobacterium sp.]
MTVAKSLELPTIARFGVELRPWRLTDAPALREACGDKEIMRFTTVPGVFTEEAATASLDFDPQSMLALHCKVKGKGQQMQGPNETDQGPTATDGDGLDPREAAQLLEQAKRDAKRQLNLSPPWITAFMAAVILVGYGALWLSTRGQHPYSGPSAAAIVLVYVGVAFSIGAAAKVYQRATAGISGPAVRQRQLEGVAILISYLGSPVLQGAMKHYGASDAIVYGVIPAAAPLIIVGTTVLGIAATKADWPQFAAALTVVIGGIVAAFVGPSAAWLAAGIGLFLGVVAYAVATGNRMRLVQWYR